MVSTFSANWNDAVLIPTNSPKLFTSAPPELPSLIAASVCKKFWWPVVLIPIRPRALIIPWVMVWPKLYGLPMASTTSPMLVCSCLLCGMLGKFLASMFSTARSVYLSKPINSAVKNRPSWSATMI